MLIKLGAKPHFGCRTILNVEKEASLSGLPNSLRLGCYRPEQSPQDLGYSKPEGDLGGRVELDLATGWELEAFTNRKAVGPFGWGFKLKWLQNLAADQCRGMR